MTDTTTDPAAISSIVNVLDCADAERLADFWAAALGYPGRSAVTQFVVLSPPDGDGRPNLILQQVPEGKVAKNRMHMDLHAPDREAALERLLALGARKIQEEPNCIGRYCWYLMADPEGNEFCLAPG
ncbi:MAG: VOC family protein [Chloroflexota bacterium]